MAIFKKKNTDKILSEKGFNKDKARLKQSIRENLIRKYNEEHNSKEAIHENHINEVEDETSMEEHEAPEASTPEKVIKGKLKIAKSRKPRTGSKRVELSEEELVKLAEFLNTMSTVSIFPTVRRALFSTVFKLIAKRGLQPSEAQMKKIREFLDLTTLRGFPQKRKKRGAKILEG